MLNQFNRILEGQEYQAADLLCTNEIWFSYDHHGEYAGSDMDAVLNRINTSLRAGKQALEQAGLLMITFGSARTFCLAENGQPVANCHRSPANAFRQVQADPETMVTAYLDLFRRLRLLNPSLNILLSVSPVRHLREGLVQNNRSKARLFLLIEALCEQAEGVHYFPAYELLLDVMRDYRWFADDFAHPSRAAIALIHDDFMAACSNIETLEFSRRIRVYNRDAAHRPRFPETAAFAAFEEGIRRQRETLLRDYPELDARGFFTRQD